MCSRCKWKLQDTWKETHFLFLLPLSPPTSFRPNCRHLHHWRDCRYPSVRPSELDEDALRGEGSGWISLIPFVPITIRFTSRPLW